MFCGNLITYVDQFTKLLDIILRNFKTIFLINLTAVDLEILLFLISMLKLSKSLEKPNLKTLRK